VAVIVGTVTLLLPSPRQSPLGAYAGYENVSGVAQLSHVTGKPVYQAMDFFDGTTWQKAVESPLQIVPVWNKTTYKMTWGVTMLPDNGGTLAIGATGQYNHYFATIARYLVANHQGSSTIRLGWEFNGSWFAWSAYKCPSCFIAYWRQIVTTMRSVQGAHFLFEWNPAAGSYAMAPPSAYPGDNYVDLIGLDVYDNVPGSPSQKARWQTLLDEPFGLNWVLGFAQDHGKPVTLPEWGLGYPPDGAGDDPYFITKMAQFIAANPQIVSALYWNYGTSQLSGAPLSKVAFGRAFGS
jgi:beta-mannanase